MPIQTGKRFVIYVLLAVVGGAGCSDSRIAVVQDAVRARLKDPESARFGEIKFGDESFVCGIVNAKNAYGGYVGDQIFNGTLSSGGFFVLTLGGDEIEQKVALQMCEKYGVTF